jgi:hypothetical protein
MVLRGSGDVGPACVTPKGSGTTGAPCHFTLAQGAARVPSRADSDCAPGYLCYSPFFDPTIPATCRPFCWSQFDCSADESCVEAFNAAEAGVCYPSCDPFGAACEAGLTCMSVPHFPDLPRASGAVCARPGTANGTCSNDPGVNALPTDLCPAGLQCAVDPLDASKPARCFAICRTQSDCPSATTCTGSNCSRDPYCVCR